jgi:hypothetical protein
MEDVDVGRQDGVGLSHRVCNKDNILLGQVIVAQVIQWGYRYRYTPRYGALEHKLRHTNR